MRAIHIIKREKKAEATQLRQKALEPLKRHCYILDKEVSILVEYPDYKGPHHKGEEGAIYCENIVNCYQNNVKCRYSGISPLYADPFYPREKPAEPESTANDPAESDELPEAEPKDEIEVGA
ncbi:MAG: hypothetical protein AMXMBFR33_70180 [Candidatus Xenobia bacterium]